MFFIREDQITADSCTYRPVGVVACSFGGRELSDVGVDGSPGVGEPGDQGDDRTVVPCVQL